jgi:signal transduction histidine kinase
MTLARAGAISSRAVDQKYYYLPCYCLRIWRRPLPRSAAPSKFVQRFGHKADVDLPRIMVRLEIAASRATSLVRTLTDAQALDSGELALTIQPLNLRAVVSPVVHMLDRLSDRHPVALMMPDTPVPVRGDAERLQRVVENLLTNAIKYSPEGGPVEVTLSVTGEATLAVRDHGIGISPDALAHIFERAYRAPNAVTTAPGLGLGLSIAAEIVKRHGGALQARPADGRGTIVSLTLPVESLAVSKTDVSGATDAMRRVQNRAASPR